MLGVGLLLTIGTGLFVASEFALVNLDRADLEARQAAGENRLSLTISALRITSTHLSSAQLGITLTTLLTGYTMEPAISNLLAPVFDAWGIPSGVSRPLAAIIGVSIATVFSMIIGELVPKNFALAVPRQTAKLVMPFQVAFTTVFRPAIVVLNGSANGVLRSVGIEPKEELSGARTAEELSSLVRRSASAGVLEEDTVIFPGELRPDEVRDRTGIRIPEGDVYDTVGGYIMSVLERIPVVGDSVEIEDGTIEVQRMEGRRVDRVRFTPTPMPHEDANEGGDRR